MNLKELFTVNKKLLIQTALLLAIIFCLYAGTVYFSGFEWKTSLFVLLFSLIITIVFLIKKEVPRWGQIAFFLITPAVSFYLLEILVNPSVNTMSNDALVLNLIFYYLLAILTFLISGSLRVALCIQLAICVFAGVANYYVLMFRSIPILPWDLLSIRTAASVADNFVFSISYPFLFILLGFLLLFIISFKLTLAWEKKAMRAIMTFICLIPTFFYIQVLHIPDLDNYTSLDNTLFTPRNMYETNGFAVSFLMNLRYLNIVAPEGYTTERAESLLPEAQEVFTDGSSDKAMPNIIVIMNETFSDPQVLGEIKTNEDIMPFIHSLEGADNTITGDMYVSILGGNTANTEFEFLTGNTMAFLPQGSVAYQQYVHGQIPNIVTTLKNQGYSTYAIHPFNASGWNRDTVYDYFCFDEKFFVHTFPNTGRMRGYVSDLTTYEKIIDLYENKDSNSPMFVFDVTMQNHSGYDGHYDDFDPKIEMEGDVPLYTQNYLSLLKESDLAFEQLVNYFENKEDTIIVFFGDHQPNDYVVEPIYKANGIDYDSLSLEEKQNRYIVPFVIWANYDIPDDDIDIISPNFLGPIVMDLAGVKKNAYQEFLSSLYEEIPVTTSNIFINKDGLFSTWEEQTALLNNYKFIQYYYLFEKQ